MKKTLKKIIIAITFLVLAATAIVVASLYDIPSIYSLEVTFELNEKLEIKVCNPTSGIIGMTDKLTYSSSNLLYSDDLSIAYTQYYQNREKIVNGPLKRQTSDLAFIPTKYLLPKECISQIINIRYYLPNTTKPFRIRLEIHNDESEWDDYNSDNKKILKSVVFESQKFEL